MSAFLPPPALPTQPPPRPVRHKTVRRPRLHCTCATSLPRRRLLRTLAAAAAGLVLPTPAPRAATLCWPATCTTVTPAKAPPAYTVFSVVPTSLSDVNLTPLSIAEVIDDTATARAVLLGEHHNSLVDHALEARIIDELRRKGELVVGLEMVQQRFQDALDRFVSGNLDELGLYVETEWETRWVWPYENYLPVLRVCRKYHIPLVALSLNSEVLSKVKAEGGIENLSAEEMRAHIGDPAAFVTISKLPAFKRYISEIITPSYASHYRRGLLPNTANFASFYTARVLRDEAMATCTVQAMQANPDAVMLCLMGSDHVKFEYGVKARIEAQLLGIERRANKAREAEGVSPVLQPPPKLRSVMLNPGPADAYDPRDKSLKLEMAVEGNPVPIADYLWFSSVADAKPRRRVREWVLPPVEFLTAM